MKIISLFCLLSSAGALLTDAAVTAARSERFDATTPAAARHWQIEARSKLYQLMMGGAQPRRVPLQPKVLRQIDLVAGDYRLEELTLQSLPDRVVHAWMAVPKHPKGKVGAVVALHGHGGTGEEVVRGKGLYWYGRALMEMGYVVIAPDVGSHELQHTNWSLMGERTWDAIRCVDYLTSRPEVDRSRLAVAGLSLGGETTMYLAALDERLKAVCSSGWLTTIDNMKHGHCPCWDSPGLEANFDFADIFACIAPRPLVCEVGTKERAPGGFPVEIARRAFEEVRAAYKVFNAEDRLHLDVHSGGHVFRGADFWGPLHAALGTPFPWREDISTAAAPGHDRPVVEEALRRGEIARRNFCRALGVLDSWWALREPATGLYPRRVDQPVWAPQDNAADMMPFLFLTAHYLVPERKQDLLQVLHSEKEITDRVGVLPDWYSITNHRFLFDKVEMPRLIFGAAEYCKDGLIPMTEVMGRGPWTDRMFELIDAIFQQATVQSDFGTLPADDTEVNGDVLQTLGRLYAMTHEAKYLAWAERIGDAYCLEVLPKNGGLPPYRWDFQRHALVKDVLNLNDHGNEIIGGLAELYVIARAYHPEKAAQYREPMRAMFHRLIDKARNEDGLWYNLMRASSAEVLNPETPDTWGYALSATATFGMATDDPELIAAVQRALHNINRPRYLDWDGADSYADSIEGSLLLLNRFPVREGFEWLEKVLPVFLGKQQDNGIVEGWYGDGNYARTALMVGLYFTQGASCQPWRPDLRFGALRRGGKLHVALSAAAKWDGKLLFDQPRHSLHLRLPVNYPRLNEFPEWFTADPNAAYRVKVGGGRPEVLSGAALARGITLRLRAGETIVVEVEPMSSANHRSEVRAEPIGPVKRVTTWRGRFLILITMALAATLRLWRAG